MPTWSKAIPDLTSPAACGLHLLKFKKRPKMSYLTALFALSLMQCQRRVQISRVKNIGNVFQLSSLTFHLAPLYGRLRVYSGKWDYFVDIFGSGFGSCGWVVLALATKCVASTPNCACLFFARYVLTVSHCLMALHHLNVIYHLDAVEKSLCGLFKVMPRTVRLCRSDRYASF